MSLEEKRAGELIRAEDWNELVAVVQDLQAKNTALQAQTDQLKAGKLGLAEGGRVTGLLEANVVRADAVRSAGLGAEFARPAGNAYEHSTNQSSWQTLVTKQVGVSRATTFLLIGHGAGKAEDGTHPLDVGIFKDSQWQGTEGVAGASDVAWGLGYSGPSTDSLRHTGQIVALAVCRVEPGSPVFQLKYRARTGQKLVTVYGPSLWIIRLGDPTA
jgi:hypothetical protein